MSDNIITLKCPPDITIESLLNTHFSLSSPSNQSLLNFHGFSVKYSFRIRIFFYFIILVMFVHGSIMKSEGMSSNFCPIK